MTRDQHAILQMLRMMAERLERRQAIIEEYNEFWGPLRGLPIQNLPNDTLAKMAEFSERLNGVPDVTEREKAVIVAFGTGQSVLLAKLAAE